jgi:short-subunit dehydrogenase
MKAKLPRILITGAAGGIGFAVAERLAASGRALLLTDVGTERLERAAGTLAAKGVDVLAAPADVTSRTDRERLVACAREADVNTLVNVAGVNPFGLFAEQAAADIETALMINTCAPMLLCQALLPHLSGLAEAHIVNVGSTFGSIGFPGFCTYSASKYAIRGFSEALRRELADTPIRVHYVAPRATRTALATDRVRAMNDELGVGMDAPETVARAIEKALHRGRREVYLGLPERIFALLNALAPGIVDRSIKKQLPIIRRHAARKVGADAPTQAAPIPLHAHRSPT